MTLEGGLSAKRTCLLAIGLWFAVTGLLAFGVIPVELGVFTQGWMACSAVFYGQEWWEGKQR